MATGATRDARAVDLFAEGIQALVRNNRGGDQRAWTWSEVEALIAPVHALTFASHRDATGQSGQIFIAIAS